MHRWRQLQGAASAEIRAFDRPPYVDNPLEPDATELQRLADGVAYRVIYSQDVLDEPGRYADVESGVRAGEEAAVSPHLPAKLTLFDDVAASVALAPGEPSEAALVVVHQSPLLDALSALFESYWQQATRLALDNRQHLGGSRPGDDPMESRLVQLLASGMTDEAIQHTLGVSASTVHRRVHALMVRLGARSRFQAGLQLGLRNGGTDAPAMPLPQQRPATERVHSEQRTS